MHVVASALAFTDLSVLASRPWIEPAIVESMNGLVEDSLILPENVACAIADMHIPIEDCNFLNSQLFLGVARSDSHIIEEAEASYVGARGVMTRRPDDAEGTVYPAAHHSIDSLASTTRGKERRSGSVSVFVGVVLIASRILS